MMKLFKLSTLGMACRVAWCLPLLALAAPEVQAQQAQAERGPLRITPSVRVSETLTDNVTLASKDARQSDWITTITPSLALTGSTGHSQNSLQVSLNSSLYKDDTSRNTNYLTMQALSKLDAFDRKLFLDLQASISREVVSAFGPRSADGLTGQANQASVQSFSASPYYRMRFAGGGNAELRYTLTQTHSDAANYQNTNAGTWAINAGDPYLTGRLGWSASASDSTTQYSNRRDVHVQLARLYGLIHVTPELTLRAIGGVEGNNYSTTALDSRTIYGAGFEWNLSPRTRVDGNWEDRFFGAGYNLNAEHRMSRVVFRSTLSRDVSSSNQNGTAAVTMYDLLMTMFASTITDYTARDAYVRQYMQSRNLTDTVLGTQQVLSNGATLLQRAQVSMAIEGVRNTFAVTASRASRRSVTDQTYSLGTDLSSNTQVNDTTGSAILSHQLTPLTSANIDLTMTRSVSDGSSGQAVSLRTRRVSLGLNTRLTKQTSVSCSVRNNKGSGNSEYSENAVVGSVSVQF
jgi:uncharacterized protein (PEP-CTERM system associated)